MEWSTSQGSLSQTDQGLNLGSAAFFMDDLHKVDDGVYHLQVAVNIKLDNLFTQNISKVTGP